MPAGKLDKEGEDSASCAIRELSEETGLIAQKVTLLHTLYPTPGYTNEKLYVYLAEGVSRGDAHLDEGEFLNVEYFPLDEVVAMIERGEINDAKTIVGIYRYILMQK